MPFPFLRHTINDNITLRRGPGHPTLKQQRAIENTDKNMRVEQSESGDAPALQPELLNRVKKMKQKKDV